MAYAEAPGGLSLPPEPSNARPARTGVIGLTVCLLPSVLDCGLLTWAQPRLQKLWACCRYFVALRN